MANARLRAQRGSAAEQCSTNAQNTADATQHTTRGTASTLTLDGLSARWFANNRLPDCEFIPNDFGRLSRGQLAPVGHMLLTNEIKIVSSTDCEVFRDEQAMHGSAAAVQG